MKSGLLFASMALAVLLACTAAVPVVGQPTTTATLVTSHLADTTATKPRPKCWPTYRVRSSPSETTSTLLAPLRSSGTATIPPGERTRRAPSHRLATTITTLRADRLTSPTSELGSGTPPRTITPTSGEAGVLSCSTATALKWGAAANSLLKAPGSGKPSPTTRP